MSISSILHAIKHKQPVMNKDIRYKMEGNKSKSKKYTDKKLDDNTELISNK